MKTKKLILNIIIAIIVLAIVAIVIWVKFVPTQKISFLAKQDSHSAISQALCNYPVKVVGDSMEPVLHNGKTINFNKCFEPEGLAVGQVVAYKSEPMFKIGVVREIVTGESGKYYQVSPASRTGDISQVLPDNIVAIYFGE